MCVKPLVAFLSASGEVCFADRLKDGREVKLPCGQCVECRLLRSSMWAVRCMHEAQLHEFNSFITLTYNDEHYCVSLRYLDYQLFMRRLRRVFPKVRFYMCGEYGEQDLRPHFHALLFGVFFADRQLWSNRGGVKLYRSATLERLWTNGYSTIGDVTFESAAYCARYIMKKITGDMAEVHYERVHAATGELVQVVPEFSRMSLKPGIGAEWFKRFGASVCTRDNVIVSGRPTRVPRYYDVLRKQLDSYELDDAKMRRLESVRWEDNTPDRLLVREEVVKARVGKLVRSL